MRPYILATIAGIGLTIAIAIVCAGCTSIKFEGAGYKFSRVSFAQKVNVRITEKDGNLEVVYGNDGGADVAKKAAEGVAAGITLLK